MSEDKKIEEQSRVNVAANYVNTIHQLLQSADIAGSNLDSYAWFASVVALKDNLITEISKKESEELDKKIEVANVAVNDLQNRRVARPTMFIPVPNELFLVLRALTNDLRMICYKSGFLIKKERESNADEIFKF